MSTIIFSKDIILNNWERFSDTLYFREDVRHYIIDKVLSRLELWVYENNYRVYFNGQLAKYQSNFEQLYGRNIKKSKYSLQ